MARAFENLAVLRSRDFRLLLSGQAVSVLGDRMVAVALAFAVLEIGGSPSDVGLVLAAGVLPLVGSVLVGGVVADRTSRRAVMVVSDLLRLASQGTMAALLIAGGAEVWMLAVLAGVTGVGTGFFSPASTGLLPAIVPAEQLQPANALRSSAVSAGEILGPLVAGVFVAVAGAGWAVAADAATFGVSAACLVLLRLPAHVPGEASTFLTDLRQGWVAFASRRWVWAVVAYFAIGNIVWSAWNALGPVVADRDLGGAAAWGTVLAAVGVGALIGSLLATQANPSRPLVFVALTDGLFALPLACLAAAPSVPLLVAGALLSGAGTTLGISVWESTLQRHIPDESLSRVSSYDWFGSLVFSPVGLAIWAPIAALIGTSAALWVAFGIAVATILALLAVPDIRRLNGETIYAEVV
ncbi:MAG TPA: MFS transporter [Baekduia sp.]|nr:MFS transporter [Baekduia sp.]